MPRPRKPTEALELSGAFEKNPNRRRAVVASAGPIGEPPPSLPPEAHAVWHEVVEMLPARVLKKAHRIALEDFCVLVLTKRTGGKWSAWHQGALQWHLSRFGLTPADESKLSMSPGTDEPNPFDRFRHRVAEARRKPN